MSKHDEKREQKSPAKLEISGALNDDDLEKVTGGDKASPKETVSETLTLNFTKIAFKYTP